LRAKQNKFKRKRKIPEDELTHAPQKIDERLTKKSKLMHPQPSTAEVIQIDSVAILENTVARGLPKTAFPVAALGVSSHPFPTDVGDHCETPLEAYTDVVPLLRGLARDLGLSSPAALRIYDPFFCEGSMKAHLAALGFPRVLNENVDFYQSPQPPSAWDVLLTNPPYSADHVPKILAYCADLSAREGKPWLLLVPAYVHDKPFYARLVPPALGVCYLWPWRRCVSSRQL
jgi:hypothetical protein